MDKIEWSDEYSVGVGMLDEQHRELVEILNKLIGSTNISVNSETLHDALYELIKYAEKHFKCEESLLQDYDYPELEAHSKGHSEFIETVANLALSATQNDKSVPEHLLLFLSDWLNRHILIEDMKYRPFFEEISVK